MTTETKDDLAQIITLITGLFKKEEPQFFNSHAQMVVKYEEVLEKIHHFFQRHLWLQGYAQSTQHSFEAIINKAQKTLIYEIKLAVKKIIYKPDSTIRNEHTSWVPELWQVLERRPQWEAYQAYLLNEKKWRPEHIADLDAKTDSLLDGCGDPNVPASQTFSRRGMAIGQVQSGKTATYTALLNKAVDAGYDVLIVLAGLTSELQSQTQSRLDKELCGRVPNEFQPTGIGNYAQGDLDVVALTMAGSDEIQRNGLGGKHPVLLVLKKNVRRLSDLKLWLKKYLDFKEDLNVLLIDDEADNATVNTNDPDSDPTAINASIREILALGNRVSYIGFTATPFANVFIEFDGDKEVTADDLLGEDLFPRDFITLLEPPSNYFGLSDLVKAIHRAQGLEEEDPDLPCIHTINDGEGAFQGKRNDKDFVPTIPKSLKASVRQFFLVNAIRDLRGEPRNTHRSMVVNVTTRNLYQKNILADIEDFINKEIKGPLLVAPEDQNGILNPYVRELKAEFEKHFTQFGFTWDEVFQELRGSSTVEKVQCKLRNRESDHLDYADHKDGCRYIVVGGLSLSRGLTLEGLCVTYLYRTTAYYDTLMQMGRFFGYRDGYGDLCQIWLGQNTVTYMEQINDAVETLMTDLRLMARTKAKPSDFGIRILMFPGRLAITSPRKMQSATKRKIRLSFSGLIVENFHLQVPQLDRYNAAVKELIVNMKEERVAVDEALSSDRARLYTDVPIALIHQFIKDYGLNDDISSHVRTMSGSAISDYLDGMIANDYEPLSKWDVVFHGVKTSQFGSADVDGVPIASPFRSCVIEKNTLRIDGSNTTAAEFERVPFTSEEIKAFKEKGYGRNDIRAELQRPQLILVPVAPTRIDEAGNCVLLDGITSPVWMPAFVFTYYGDRTGKDTVMYALNSVAHREFLEMEALKNR